MGRKPLSYSREDLKEVRDTLSESQPSQQHYLKWLGCLGITFTLPGVGMETIVHHGPARTLGRSEYNNVGIVVGAGVVGFPRVTG